jgi:hypothetical protein
MQMRMLHDFAPKIAAQRGKEVFCNFFISAKGKLIKKQEKESTRRV